MNKDYQSILISESEDTKENLYENSIFMGGVLVLTNLLLMITLGIYWTNTSVHQFISGRPL